MTLEKEGIKGGGYENSIPTLETRESLGAKDVTVAENGESDKSVYVCDKCPVENRLRGRCSPRCLRGAQRPRGQ